MVFTRPLAPRDRSTIVFEPGGIREYVGGYDDWLRQRPEQTPAAVSEKRAAPAAPEPPARKKKLSYKDQQELAGLPAKIEQLEAAIAEIHTAMADPAFYQQPGPAIAKAQADLQQREAELAAAYGRWETLEQVAEETK
jgi:ATP-binding cassette subfamily F protein uup